MPQQQQQYADYDLLAVFPDESKADAAETKLHREGFSEEEVFRLEGGVVAEGEFREHGPNRNRGAFFLQTTRTGPSPVRAILFALLFGLILAGVTFLLFVANFAVTSLPETPTIVVGAIIGILLGAIVGFLQRGRMRGAIGQNTTQATHIGRKRPGEERTVIAVRLPDPENITRKSRARAILLNNGGKIDRSVGR